MWSGGPAIAAWFTVLTGGARRPVLALVADPRPVTARAVVVTATVHITVHAPPAHGAVTRKRRAARTRAMDALVETSEMIENINRKYCQCRLFWKYNWFDFNNGNRWRRKLHVCLE